MTEQECLGIDCAWCADPNCPNERKNMKTEKKVTRLLENISKARDILDTGDFKKVSILGIDNLALVGIRVQKGLHGTTDGLFPFVFIV